MREGDILELCVPGKMPEPWEAQIRYYSAVGSAGETDRHIRSLINEIQDLDILSDYFSRDPSRASEDGIETARSLSTDMVNSIEDRVNTGETAYRFFGWWEGDTLAGAVSIQWLSMVDAVLICNIYVLPPGTAVWASAKPFCRPP